MNTVLNEITTCEKDFSLAFKREKGQTVYVAGTDQFGYPVHTNKESEAWRVYSLDEALSYYNLGYGIETRVMKSQI